MNKLLDLRFIIGAFFSVIGMLLLGYSFLGYCTIDSVTINRWCGIVFIAFGLLMIFLSFQNNGKDE
jgi:hypothetical protein